MSKLLLEHRLCEMMEETYSIYCDKCGVGEEHQDDTTLAKELIERGWTVTRTNRVLCDSCSASGHTRGASDG